MRDQRGFSLIEVLVVIVMIGVLAGIAISQYASYRARSFDGRVAAAIRGVATSEEAYYAENHEYAEGERLPWHPNLLVGGLQLLGPRSSRPILDIRSRWRRRR